MSRSNVITRLCIWHSVKGPEFVLECDLQCFNSKSLWFIYRWIYASNYRQSISPLSSIQKHFYLFQKTELFFNLNNVKTIFLVFQIKNKINTDQSIHCDCDLTFALFQINCTNWNQFAFQELLMNWLRTKLHRMQNIRYFRTSIEPILTPVSSDQSRVNEIVPNLQAKSTYDFLCMVINRSVHVNGELVFSIRVRPICN